MRIFKKQLRGFKYSPTNNSIMQFSLRKVCKYLPIITIGLVVLNALSAFMAQEIFLLRYVPLFTVLFFLGYYIIKAKSIKWIVIAILAMLALRELSVFYYYKNFGQVTYILLGCLAYSLILIKRLDLLDLFLKDKMSIVYALVFLTLNIFILHELISQVNENYSESFQSGLVYLFGIIISLLGAVAVLYNQVVNSDRSLAFLFFVFCFIFSDVSSLLGYYFGISFFYYIDFISAAVGLAFFLYTVLDVCSVEKEREEVENLF